MNLSLIEKIADAVLYEGYMLYPYRPSAVKNQQRWNFGALCPESYSVAQGGTEAWTMQTECLVRTNPESTLDLKVRFLHLLTREVGEVVADCRLAIAECGHDLFEVSDSHFALVRALEVNGKLFQTWQEAVERDVLLPAANVERAVNNQQKRWFTFPASTEVELLRNDDTGEEAGVVVRRQQAIQGTVELSSERAGELTFKISASILNHTPLADAKEKSRDEALMRSFVSTHTILNVHNGAFVSLLDPPEALREAAAACNNIGTYPVLVGEEGATDCMLSSPIILYDYPQIAPESAGALFDGTEIDEILTLRIMTLTDEEKREMRGADDRARQILERTEILPAEQLMKMHGAMKAAGRKS
ncbi:MAG: hypothetical protein ABJB97_00155 [Acidobacteriota bacterium]